MTLGETTGLPPFTSKTFEAALDHDGLRFRVKTIGVSIDDFWRLCRMYQGVVGEWRDSGFQSGPVFRIDDVDIQGGRTVHDGTIVAVEYR
jgi:hypothetical protein